jgi:Ca-activated chloride channel family protein
MHKSVFSNSRFLQHFALAAFLETGCLGLPLLAQAPGTPAAAPPSSTSDPTRAEIQPSLSVDRDPIPSPDPDELTTTTAAPGTSQPGEIRKRQDGVYTLHEDVDEVLLSCAVVDEHGRPVMDLSRDDFRVWEDGIPQTTRSFLHQDLPVSMGLLVDNSGSMRDKRQVVNAAALKLLTESNPNDSAFVVNFSDRAYLDQGFTTDRVALSRGLSHFDSKGTTALYDAVAASADELSKHAKQPKQVLLIITDGSDNASRLDLREAIRRVQSLGGPVVYTIGLLYDAEPKEASQARNALEMLSQETGGIAYFPRSLEEVNTIADEVAQDIRNQYTVGYHPTKSASLGGFRTVHVEIKSQRRGKLTVRTKRGYYAKTAQRTQTAQTAPQATEDAQSKP